MLYTLERQISLLLLISILILAGIGVYAYYNAQATRTAIEWEKHTQQVIQELDETLISVVDAEASVSGFIIFGREEFLESYNLARPQVFEHLSHLKNLIADNPEQIARTSAFEAQLREELDFLEQGIVLRKNGGLGAVVNTLGGTNRAKDLMDRLQQTAAEIKNEELRLLKQREEELDANVNRTFAILITSIVIGMLMLVLAELVVLREIRKREKAEQELIETNKDLEKRVGERTAQLESINENLREIANEREKLLSSEQSARREAEIANRLRDEFMMMVSHELRTPLNAILGWARVMKQGKLDEKGLQKAIETVIKSAETQNRLIEDLLDVGRIVSGKLRLEKTKVAVEEVVASAFQTVKPNADAKSIEINLNLPEGDDRNVIYGDPNRLQQVVWNLLSNAIKFTPEGGRIEVGVEELDGQVEIKIADNGVGIKPEFLPFVFERFRQETANIKQSGGLGLGLAIVRHLTEMHGGRVSAESEGENKGATFRVQLPLAKEPELN